MKSTHKSEYKKVLKQLILARKEAEITQQDLARILKTPQSFVSKYENGERRLDIIEFIEICSILRVDYRKLLKSAIPNLI